MTKKLADVSIFYVKNPKWRDKNEKNNIAIFGAP